MLRSKLTFDQLVGCNIQYGEDKSIVQGISGRGRFSSALCSNHVMRSGRHFSVSTLSGNGRIGVIRPVQIDRAAFGDGELDSFSPGLRRNWEYLRTKQTVRWGVSNGHCCTVDTAGYFCWFDWTSGHPPFTRIAGFQRDAPTGLLLDLDEGTLVVYQNGQRLAMLKDRLSGEYCWHATVWHHSPFITVERSSAPED